MKKLILLCFLALIAFSYQDGWQSLNGASEQEVTRKVIVADSTHIIYEYTIHGFNMFRYTEDFVDYYQISLPGEDGQTDSTGYPKLPYLTDILPVPECSNIEINVTYSNENTFDTLLVYPAPYVYFDSIGYAEEFEIDTNFYHGSNEYPLEDYDTSNGSFREQNVTSVTVNPIRYNAGDTSLTVFGTVQVSLSFSSPTSDLCVETGPMSHAMSELLQIKRLFIK